MRDDLSNGSRHSPQQAPHVLAQSSREAHRPNRRTYSHDSASEMSLHDEADAAGDGAQRPQAREHIACVSGELQLLALFTCKQAALLSAHSAMRLVCRRGARSPTHRCRRCRRRRSRHVAACRCRTSRRKFACESRQTARNSRKPTATKTSSANSRRHTRRCRTTRSALSASPRQPAATAVTARGRAGARCL